MFIRNFYVILLVFVNFVFSQNCNQIGTQYGHVCVCNETYCDSIPKIKLEKGKFQQFTTSSTKLGLSSTYGYIQAKSTGKAKYTIDLTNVTIKQTVQGFGASFTGSATYNIQNLNENLKEKLLNSYFGENGSQYSLCRVPIGGSDFSLEEYTYDDDHEGDFELKHFKLHEEDFKYKIPTLQRAIALTNNTLNLIGSSWTAPPWMKSNNKYSGSGFLKKEYYQVWANYYIKFFEEYEKHGVNFWGVTTQNEPVMAVWANIKVNSLAFTMRQMNEWISQNFGPTIKNTTFKDVKIFVNDDNSYTFPFLFKMLENNDTIQYIDGIGIHWYTNWLLPKDWLKYAKSSKKDMLVISTEACNGFFNAVGLEEAVELGSWTRAERYIKDIIADFEYGAVGWIDWNMALNQEGGPCVINNHVDSPIIVNKDKEEFYKQPMYYGLAHFAKFLRPESKILLVQNDNVPIKSLSAKRPDGLHASIIFNEGKNREMVEIKTKDGFITVSAPGFSILSVLF